MNDRQRQLTGVVVRLRTCDGNCDHSTVSEAQAHLIDAITRQVEIARETFPGFGDPTALGKWIGENGDLIQRVEIMGADLAALAEVKERCQ